MVIVQDHSESVDCRNTVTRDEFVLVDPGESATVEYVIIRFMLPTTWMPSSDTRFLASYLFPRSENQGSEDGLPKATKAAMSFGPSGFSRPIFQTRAS